LAFHRTFGRGEGGVGGISHAGPKITGQHQRFPNVDFPLYRGDQPVIDTKHLDALLEKYVE
jgi:hypothetical protein